MKRLLQIEWLRLRRSSAAWWLLGGLFAAGLAAIFLGHAFQQAQQVEIADLDTQFEKQSQRLEHRYQEKGEHSGYWAYYSFFPVHQPPSPLAAVSWGLRDLAPFVTWVRLLGLEQQLYESGLGNPQLQALGQFDLTFVLGVLAPLVLLLLGHDVLSRDRGLGSLPLLAAQAGGLGRIFAARLLVRFAMVALVSVLLFCVAAVVLDLPWSADSLAWLFIVLVGLLPWLGITALIAARAQSVAASLSAAMTAFVLLVILMPAMLNLTLSTLFPVPEGLELTVRQRQVMHDSWDQPRQANYDSFLARQPEYRGPFPTVPEADFTWRWYYAMHENADHAVLGLATQHLKHLRQRHQWSQRLAWLSPPAMTQTMLCARAGTDLDAHLLHLETVRSFHQQLKKHFFPIIFAETLLPPGATRSFPRFTSPAPAPAAPLSVWPPLLLAALFLLFARPRAVLS